MSLGERMKKYESVTNTKLIPNMDTVIRLDGRSFSKFTKRFKKPFDDYFVNMMNLTTKYLCENLQNVKFGFVQSDEISLYITDLSSYEDSLPFDGKIQKLVSISSSLASSYFAMLLMDYEINVEGKPITDVISGGRKLPVFDSRVFQLPNFNELKNCFIWRQRDCVKNSISSVGQFYFSTSELKNKNTNEVQDMLFNIKGVNWNDFNVGLKRGRMVTKHCLINNKDKIRYNKIVGETLSDSDVIRNEWVIEDAFDFLKDDIEFSNYLNFGLKR